MANDIKKVFLDEVKKRYGPLRKLDRSQSLFEIVNSSIRIYIRYSRVHRGFAMFYGLRYEDLIQLEGYPSLICFLWDSQAEPLFIPYSDYEEVFQTSSPASDGQYKVKIFLEDDGAELYLARSGRFNIEGNFGWSNLDNLTDSSELKNIPELSHSQIQTLLGAIGKYKGFDIWIPSNDRHKLDWALTNRFDCCNILPFGFEEVKKILQEVDVVWIQRGSNQIRALFEVEHSTPIYSGLLRFNDIHLVAPDLKPRFSVVSNDARRSLFVRQLNRPTFQKSGLNELCTFLEYVNVFGWFSRIKII